jgi:hypothetical protein
VTCRVIPANVHNHHFIIRATQFGPELQVLLAALGTGEWATRRSGLSVTDALGEQLFAVDYVGSKPTWKADDPLVLNDDDVADLVRAAVKREGSQAAFAKRYGIDRTDLSAFLNGRRRISASLARGLGLRKVYVFERGQKTVTAGPIRGDNQSLTTDRQPQDSDEKSTQIRS